MDGPCAEPCGTFGAVAVLSGLSMFFLLACHAPAFNIVMRSLPPQHVSMGLSFLQAVYKLLGSFPGPVLMGKIFDSNCLFSQPACDGSGGCPIYNNSWLSVSYTNMAVWMIACSALCYGAAVFVHKEPVLVRREMEMMTSLTESTTNYNLDPVVDMTEPKELPQ